MRDRRERTVERGQLPPGPAGFARFAGVRRFGRSGGPGRQGQGVRPAGAPGRRALPRGVERVQGVDAGQDREVIRQRARADLVGSRGEPSIVVLLGQQPADRPVGERPGRPPDDRRDGLRRGQDIARLAPGLPPPAVPFWSRHRRWTLLRIARRTAGSGPGTRASASSTRPITLDSLTVQLRWVRAVVLAMPDQIAGRRFDEAGVPAPGGAERGDRLGGHVDVGCVPAHVGGEAAVRAGHPGQIGIPVLDDLPVPRRVCQVEEVYAPGRVVHIGLRGIGAVAPSAVGKLLGGDPVGHPGDKLRRAAAGHQGDPRQRRAEDVLRRDEGDAAIARTDGGHRLDAVHCEQAAGLEGAQGVQRDQMRQDIALPDPDRFAVGQVAGQEGLVRLVASPVGVIVQDLARAQRHLGPDGLSPIPARRQVLERRPAEDGEGRPQHELLALPGTVLERRTEGPGTAQVRVPERGVAENQAALVAGLGAAQIGDQPVLDRRFRALALEQTQEQRRFGDTAGAPVPYRPV